MAFDNSYTAVTGATYQASDYNTGTKGNFTAVWVGTTAGDIDYYTSAIAKSRLALTVGGVLYGGASAPAYLAAGLANTFLRSTGSAPGYAPLVLGRKGGSSTIWTSAGTTTYTPTATVIQVGYIGLVFSSVATADQAVTYPTAFSQRPAIFFTCEISSGFGYSFSFGHNNDTTSGFTITARLGAAINGTINVGWLAIGQ